MKATSLRRIAPAGGDKLLAPVRPNAGIEADYRRRMDAFLAEMHNSLTYWLSAAYRATPPVLAEDATPAVQLRRAFRKLARRWQRKADVLSTSLALHFGTAAADRSDRAVASLMKTSGWTVAFKATPAVQDVLAATVAENVSLIKSIADQHLASVERVVMQSVQQGRDLGWLAGQLQDRHEVSKRRAALIARDQNNKATAAIQRARHLELGITEAVWMHSHGGRHPRPSHVAYDSKRYDVREGALIDGKRIWPGTEINCRCVSRTVLPGLRATAA